MLNHLVDRFTTTALVGVDVGSRWLKLIELERGECLTVDVSTMRNGNDVDPFRRIVDEIEHPIVANPNAIGGLPLQFLNADGPRIFLEREELMRDPC